MLRTHLQTLLLKTNPHWPFSRLNKLPYSAAIRLFVRACRQYPAIRGVYLRHSLLRDDWEPGLSDIDLTVVSDDNLTPAAEWDFLRSFWSTSRRLQRLAPMLSDITLMPQRHFAQWTACGVQGYEARQWRPIYGHDQPRDTYPHRRQRLQCDALNYALTYYLDFLLPRCNRPDHAAYITRREQQRLTNKIIRYAHTYQNPPQPPLRCGDGSRGQLVAAALTALEAAADQLPAATATGQAQAAATDRAVDRTALTPIANQLACVYREDQRLYVILEGGLAQSALESAAQHLFSTFDSNREHPLLLTAPTFNHLVQNALPEQDLSLRWSRRLLFGRDLLSQLAPATAAAHREKCLGLAIGSLPFARSQPFITPPSGRPLARPPIVAAAKRYLRALALLEHEGIDPIGPNLWRACQDHYPEACRQLEHLSEDPGAAREHFLFIHPLAERLGTALQQRAKVLDPT